MGSHLVGQRCCVEVHLLSASGRVEHCTHDSLCGQGQVRPPLATFSCRVVSRGDGDEGAQDLYLLNTAGHMVLMGVGGSMDEVSGLIRGRHHKFFALKAFACPEQEEKTWSARSICVFFFLRKTSRPLWRDVKYTTHLSQTILAFVA